jgi:hypothetical protein
MLLEMLLCSILAQVIVVFFQVGIRTGGIRTGIAAFYTWNLEARSVEGSPVHSGMLPVMRIRGSQHHGGATAPTAACGFVTFDTLFNFEALVSIEGSSTPRNF